jgi:hypothetical protein
MGGAPLTDARRRRTVAGVDPTDLAVRNATYAAFVRLGRAPAPEEVADDLGEPTAAVEASWRRLHEGHALVLQSGTVAPGEGPPRLLMANPFSAVPTAFRVHADGRWWDANCAWDAFGICAALHVDGRIETVCHDCGDHLAIEVRDEQPDRPDLLWHCLVPAARWWDDIAFT